MIDEPTNDPNDSASEVLDLAKALGATPDAIAGQVLRLYIPDKDRVGNEIKHHQNWVQEAGTLLMDIGLQESPGATFTYDEGVFRDPESGTVVWEKTVRVYTFVEPDLIENERNLSKLRQFLHRFGRETNQAVVVFEFDGDFYPIVKFDIPPDEEDVYAEEQ